MFDEPCVVPGILLRVPINRAIQTNYIDPRVVFVGTSLSKIVVSFFKY